MTSEAFKTNEFLRRRKLRLQQVREQSKDIAKRIRQRVQVETLKQFDDVDEKRQQDYLQKQGQLIKKLEELYAKGVESVGASHKSALDAKEKDVLTNKYKIDISKKRGQDAAAELRRKRQEKLDQQKKLLDKKLQAREAANELSREKTTALTYKAKTKAKADTQDKTLPENDTEKNVDNIGKPAVVLNDMATQWDFDEIPNEWESNVPALPLYKDDKDSIREANNNIETKSEKSKRIDLFALSDEMPISLRGGLTNENRIPIKPSLTLVTEYLQSRGMRLRETITSGSTKKHEDLQSLKQTIQQTRTSKTEGSLNICQVLDEQIVPVPSWKAERNCEHSLHSLSQHKPSPKSRHFHNVNNSQINMIFSSFRPQCREMLPSPILRRMSPFRRGRMSCQRAISEKSSNINKSAKSSVQDSALIKKNYVTQYNHSTRDTRNLAASDNIVVRDSQDAEDAYSQAIKETAHNDGKEKEHAKKLQDMRNKVAMTKQNIEKEYKDTITFLNSLPKDKPSKGVTNAYKDDHRQQMQKENRQKKLQEEYKKVEKECQRHSCTKMTHSKSKTPTKVQPEFNKQDFEYSWMPVPESDASLVIHTVPTNVSESKSGNMVKFSTVDSYHEYRSKHKHTPPTKDVCSKEKQDKRIEAIIIENNSDSIDSTRSSTSEISVENISLQRKKHSNDQSDAERIIIYKILDSKNNKKTKKAKLVKDIATSLASIEKDKNAGDKEERTPVKKNGKPGVVPFEEIKEGVYKTVNEKGDNMTSIYFSDKPNDEAEVVMTEGELKHNQPCCSKKLRKDQSSEKGAGSQQLNDKISLRKTSIPVTCDACKCSCTSTSRQETCSSKQTSVIHPSAATSSSSFKTTNDKEDKILHDGGIIKLIDEGGQETGKFYIGASGLLKDDDAYEVVIQLRKKDGNKEDKILGEKEIGMEKNPETKNKEINSETNFAVAEVQVPRIDESKTEINVQAPKENSNAKELIEQIMKDSGVEHPNSNSKANIINGKNVDIIRDAEDNFVDKAVHTSSQTSCAIVDSGPKSNSVPRPATSTYTQTSLCSPNHRPVFFHMSSSTSTAYMSPPELVLPNFLKQNYRITDDEIYESIQNYDSKDKIELDEREYTEEYDSCRCKRCLHARKVTLCKTRKPFKNIFDKSELLTPSNSAKSCSKIVKDVYRNVQKPLKNFPKKTDCTCGKCKGNVQLNECFKNHANKSKRLQKCNKKSARHIVRPSSSATTFHRSQTNLSSCELRKLGINPVIKNYVDRLLALNKESLTALKVAEQDCSSVVTPGSSIIQVSTNFNDRPQLEDKISIEQIKNMLKKQILEEISKESKNDQNQCEAATCKKPAISRSIQVPRLPLKKSVHKVKSLNISKKLLKPKNPSPKKPISKVNTSTGSSKITFNKPLPTRHLPNTIRSKSSPTPRNVINVNVDQKIFSDIESERSKEDRQVKKANLLKPPGIHCDSDSRKPCQKVSSGSIPINRATTTDSSPESNLDRVSHKIQNKKSNTINTQTNVNTDSDTNMIKVAEDKLQNMEKIADLTEKCTIRLSSLAKILEEVRKNKSLVYGHISNSDSGSDSDRKSEKYAASNKMPINTYIDDPAIEINQSGHRTPISVSTVERDVSLCTTDYVPLLTDIPKPVSLIPSNFTDQLSPLSSVNIENAVVKNRGRPPPALSRIHLKNGLEIVVPHELSTVLEVDSPMSGKLKNKSSRDKNVEDANVFESVNGNISLKNYISESANNNASTNPDLISIGPNTSKQPTKLSFNESSEDFKLQMMDLKQFNDIMLKPFISFKEHAKQCNIVPTDEGSNMDDNPKDDGVNDDISSLHSDGSLPDVIAELLKRKIISEPFKYDTASNGNSTTFSSDSTLSALALSKMRKDKRKSNIALNIKDNIVESSDTLSMSSNPDLEKAFKRLGLGWASSTLKKTKERLALSSSSNTSSSSFSQFKLKGFENFDIPALVTDSLSTILDMSKKPGRSRQADSSKNAEQQTSKTNSMTVKEFLKNELAKKITFTTQSRREDTDEEFVSLTETKMPEQIKNLGQTINEEGTFDSVPSVKENRARTSTPVQLFKSGTYRSSSSSNMSNGLFSNAEDLSSVKVTSNSVKNHSTSEKDDLAVPNFTLRKKKSVSDCSKSD